MLCLEHAFDMYFVHFLAIFEITKEQKITSSYIFRFYIGKFYFCLVPVKKHHYHDLKHDKYNES